ncbi:hypothetical protein ACFPRL_25840 [Pseudoclavibacter helvolus]
MEHGLGDGRRALPALRRGRRLDQVPADEGDESRGECRIGQPKGPLCHREPRVVRDVAQGNGHAERLDNAYARRGKRMR